MVQFGLGLSLGSTLLRPVANRFDVVAVGIEHERAVVVRVIDLAHARRSIVLAARFQSGCIESTHQLTILGDECDVQRSLRFGTRPEPELGALVLTESRPVPDLLDESNAERRERLRVERFAPLAVAHANADMVEDQFVLRWEVALLALSRRPAARR